MKFCLVFATLLAVGLSQLAVAQTNVYTTLLSGAAESPPNASPGTGTATLTVDLSASTMRLEAMFSDLTGTVSAAHIHCCTAVPGVSTAGVATPTPTFPGFPSGVSAGSYDMTFDMTSAASYNGPFITSNGGTPASAFSALVAGLDAGSAYLNIHSSTFGGGEIRGFFAPVPEPTSGFACYAALCCVAIFRRKFLGT